MHIPVLQKEVIKYLDPKSNENFIDCTIGEGGHSYAALERIAPRGKVLGIDCQMRIKPKERLILAEDNFVNLKEVVEKNKFRQINGILLDLGMSSWHLEESGRGFSFQRREPLDMRYCLTNQLTVEKIVNFWSKSDLERIFNDYGQEKLSEKIAERIIEARKFKPIANTLQLAKIINANPRKIFQALRIAVNDELTNLEKTLPQALEILEKGGRLAVISFHSLEDRIVKNFFKNQPLGIAAKKPITPSLAEIRSNPRSRSAKLRVIMKQ